MHHCKSKFRLLAALQPANPTDPPGYTGADGLAYQAEKFVVMLSAHTIKHVAAP